MQNTFWQSGSDSRWLLCKKIKKILIELEPPLPFMGNSIENFHFIFRMTSPIQNVCNCLKLKQSKRASKSFLFRRNIYSTLVILCFAMRFINQLWFFFTSCCVWGCLEVGAPSRGKLQGHTYTAQSLACNKRLTNFVQVTLSSVMIWVSQFVSYRRQCVLSDNWLE